MSVETKTRLAPALPHVNLLPPEISERKKLAQVQGGAAVLLVLAVAAVGFLYFQGKGSVDTANKRVATANAQSARLTATVASFANVRQVQAARDAQEAMLTQAMSSEIQWSNYLGNFTTLPTSTWLTNLTLSESVAPGTITTPSAAPPLVGTVAFVGIAMKYSNVADWLDQIATIGTTTGLTNGYFNSANSGFIGTTSVVNFAGTADLSASALSGRCTKPGVC